MVYIWFSKWLCSLVKSLRFISFNSGIILVLLWYLPIQPAGANDSISINNDHTNELSHNQLKIGERLFYGLIKTGDNTVSCSSCHYFFQGDSLNWNPSAYDISASAKNMSSEQFKSVLLSPTGKKISEVHSNINLTDEQITLIKGYLLELNKKGETPSKPVVNKLLGFIGLILLMLIAIADLAFFKKIPYKAVHIIVVIVAGLLITKTVVHAAIAVGRSENYEPDQPIKFSHTVHVQQNKIDCNYCHSTVEQSKTASIPSANVCMNCHVLVREGTRSGKFEINKIISAVENKKPIEWVKVHNLPDYVFFSHAQHVGVGKVACQTCHGPVETMDRIKQVSDLSMGWCVNCHRDTKVKFTDNAFYAKYEELHKQIKEGKIDSVTVDKVGGLDCMKCHY